MKIERVSNNTMMGLERGEPVVVVSRAHDLDLAFDAAAQFFGSPLDCGDWRLCEPEDLDARAWQRVETYLGTVEDLMVIAVQPAVAS